MLLIVMMAAGLQATDSLTLEAALDRARRHRAEIAAASARLATGRADRLSASRLPNPLLSYSFTESPPRQHATVDQPLDWLLRRGPDVDAARWRVAAAEADSAQVVVELVRDATIAFYRVIAARETAALTSDQAVLADSLARLAAIRFDAGDVSAFERDQAVLEARRARLTVSEAEEAWRVARADLARAIALPLEDLPAPAGRLDGGLDEPILADTAQARPPQIEAALADSGAALATQRSVRRARWPLPSIQVGLEWDDPMALDSRRYAVLGVTVPVPLFQWGGPQAAAAEAGVRAANAALAVRRAEVRRLTIEVETRLRGAATRARAVRDSLRPLARRQLQRALEAYEAGEIGLVPTLEAIRSDRQVAADLVAGLLAFQEARAADHALRGDAE